MKVNQAGVPETLFGLVKHYSPTGEEADVVDWLVNHFQSLGYDSSTTDEIGNAIGIKGSGSKQIVFLGHIDTVPGNLKLIIKDGEFWGRGTVDAKGPLSAFVDAVSEMTIDPEWQVVVVGAVGEEGDSRGAWFIKDHLHPEYAVIGEPSRFDRITIGYKGVTHFKITCSQPNSHSAGEESSAADKVFFYWSQVLNRVAVFNAGYEKVFDQLQPTILKMGSEQDGFTQKAWMEISVRLPVHVSPQAWAETWLPLDERVEVTVSEGGINAFEADKNTDLARAFIKGIRSVDARPGYVKKTGTADVNIVAPVWNCPAIVYGPGNSNLDHTQEERISIEEYKQSVAVIKAALAALGIGQVNP